MGAIKSIADLLSVFVIAVWLVLHVQAVGADSALDSVLNTIYTIEKREVRLIKGRAESQAAPGLAATVTTTVYDAPVFGDLNGDGRNDAALILVHNPGGSGTFYYVAAAVAKDSAYQGTEAVFLGDRIAPKQIVIRNGMIVTDFAVRGPKQPMAEPPTINRTACFVLQEGQLAAIVVPRDPCHGRNQ